MSDEVDAHFRGHSRRPMLVTRRGRLAKEIRMVKELRYKDTILQPMIPAVTPNSGPIYKKCCKKIIINIKNIYIYINVGQEPGKIN